MTAVTNSQGVATFSNILIGIYTVEEVATSEQYIIPDSQTVTIAWNEVTQRTFANDLKKGNLEVVKSAEDGFVEGITFHLYGTALSGASVNEYATTNAQGVASFFDIPIGENYTLVEVDTAEQYIVPDSQNITVYWNEVTSANFYNELKHGDLKVVKTSEDNFVESVRFHLYGTALSGAQVDLYADTDADGVVTFSNVLISGTEPYTIEEVDTAVCYVIPDAQTDFIYWDEVTTVCFENILKKFSVTLVKKDAEGGAAQGNATLAGAKYGIYDGDTLVDVYYTDANGSFVTTEYICGDYWTIREMEPSEGYLLDETIHHVGAEATLYTIEHNTTSNDVTEQVIKGSIAIIKHTDDGSTQIETPEVGAEFEIFLKSSESYDAADSDERDVLICDEYGFAQSKDLPYGIYTVHQAKGWDGREKMPDFDVYVAADGQIYRYLINNAAFASRIKVVKIDAETGKTIPYAGAGFQIYDPNGNQVTMTYTYPEITQIDTFYTNSEGSLITPEALDYGEGYTLVEIQAPYGYILDSTPVSFDVTAENATSEDGITIVLVTQQDVSQKGIIKIFKTGEVFDTVVETESGGCLLYQPGFAISGLPGAKYQITAAEDIYTPDGTLRYAADTVVDEIVTDQEGIAVSKELYLGTYRIAEIEAPYGMVLNREVHEVILAYAGQEIAVTETSLSIVNQRQKAELSLTKALEQDALFNLGLGDEYLTIHFGIFAAENLVAKDGSLIPENGLLEIVPLNEDGSASFQTDLPLGHYYVCELATDEHYILNDTQYPVAFTCTDSESAIVFLAVNEGEKIINELIYGSVFGQKVGEDHEGLSGAVIGLFYADTQEFTEDTAILTTISGENGYFIFENIPYGNWLIREIAAPEGHVLCEESFEVTSNRTSGWWRFRSPMKRFGAT